MWLIAFQKGRAKKDEQRRSPFSQEQDTAHRPRLAAVGHVEVRQIGTRDQYGGRFVLPYSGSPVRIFFGMITS